ncbi:hypothetical protein D0861_01311 [Hortaea werneckii]|uniref:BTB domain-containing protein n=1 Tax=Hortaea werneckii TaxID=91943 RepID=A0A3M7G043_HORWE|nr:hypothetical protein D0861_01311 [Hortaea werneckii]
MEELRKVVGKYRHDNFATVSVGSIIYQIPESQYEKFKIRCPEFFKALERHKKSPEADFYHNCVAFDLFLFWVSEERLPDLIDDVSEKSGSTKDECAGRLHDSLFELWMFAGRYSIPSLQNDAMRSLLEVLGCTIVKPAQLEVPLHFVPELPVGNAMLLEVAHDLLAGSYPASEVQQFAELDGFLLRFITLVGGHGPFDPKETSPSRQFADGRDVRAFMVREE